MTPLATYLATSCPTAEVRLAGGGLFKRATQVEMLAMIAMKAIKPKLKGNGDLAYWVMVGPVARVRMALKAQRRRVDAEANHTVQRGVAGFAHRMWVCESYAR
jgi:hypothetical protein